MQETLVQTSELQQAEQIFEAIHHACAEYLYHNTAIQVSLGNPCCFMLLYKKIAHKQNQEQTPKTTENPTTFSFEWENLTLSFLPLGLYDVKGC